MIFWRAKELLEGGTELFRAEAELMSKRVQRMLISSLFVVMMMLFAIVGLALLTAGAAVFISEEIGWGATLLSMGGFYVLVCVFVYTVFAIRASVIDSAKSTSNESRFSDDPTSPKAKAQDAKERLDNATSADPEKSPRDRASCDYECLLDGIDSLKDSAIEAGMKNPVAIGSAALLVVSLLGPGKTFKMISRGVAAAGLASTLLEVMIPPKDNKPEA